MSEGKFENKAVLNLKELIEGEKQLRDVKAKLEGGGLWAVDEETGGHVCFLFCFRDMRPLPCSLTILKNCGYRTDFAEWSENGEMLKMLEDFE